MKKSLRNNVSTNILKFNAFIINVSSESINALKIIMINLNAFNFKITSYTSDEYEVYMNI